MKQSNTKLFVVIHSEIEFDWSKNEFINSSKVSHGDSLIKLCHQLIDMNVKIILAVDYGFVTSIDGQRVIEEFKQYPEYVCFASHMHPWNTPPFEPNTVIDEKLSFPGNLPFKQEFDKIESITKALTDITGIKPNIYLAGRYGIGQNTNTILTELGYQIDISVSPFTDFSKSFGPNFIDYDNQHFRKGVIEYFPHTVGFIANIPLISDYLNNNKHIHYKLNSTFFGKILLRLFQIKRVRLSSEGFTFDEVIKLSESLIRNGSDFLLFSFHSSSLSPGNTFYAKNNTDCNELKSNILNTIKHFLEVQKLKTAFFTVENNSLPEKKENLD